VSAESLLLFVVAGLLLNLTPGPDVLYIVTQSLRSGVRAGVAAAFGITAGCFVHIFAAAVGLGALLAASTTTFTLLKWVGAAYLVYIGVRLLRAPAPAVLPFPGDRARSASSTESLWHVFGRGFATNALNPKVALFFLAFVPQFIGPSVADKTLAFLLLGLLFNFNALWVNLGWAAVASWTAGRVGAVRRSLHRLEKAAGLMFLGFGLRLALSDNPTR
jgi:threonine/homoserine/homoserine lactone efflux protein